MTLDELLALLPDNSAGDISAADMREIVTSLYYNANMVFSQYAYKWSTTNAPGAGKLYLPVWGVSAGTTMYLNDVDANSVGMSYTGIDQADPSNLVATAIWSVRVDGTDNRLDGKFLGGSVAQTGFHEVPVSIINAVGSVAPGANTPLTFAMRVTVIIEAGTLL